MSVDMTPSYQAGDDLRLPFKQEIHVGAPKTLGRTETQGFCDKGLVVCFVVPWKSPVCALRTEEGHDMVTEGPAM